MQPIRMMILGACVVATLGFGIVSAMAQPAVATSRQICTFERDEGACVACCSGYGSEMEWWDSSTKRCYCRPD